MRLALIMALILDAFIAFNILIAFAEYMTTTDFAGTLFQVIKMLFIFSW